MEAKFSPRVKDLIRISREEAVRLKNEFVAPEHLLLAIIKLNEGKAFELLKEFDISFETLSNELETILKQSSTNAVFLPTNIPLLKQSENILKQSFLESKLFRSSMIGTEHILLTILKYEDCVACQVLNKYGIMYENLKE